MTPKESKFVSMQTHFRRLMISNGVGVAEIVGILRKPVRDSAENDIAWGALIALVLEVSRRVRTASPLIDYLSAGGRVNDELAAFLADVLRGKVKLGRKPLKPSQLVSKTGALNTVKHFERDLIACLEGDNKIWSLFRDVYADWDLPKHPPSGRMEAKSLARELAFRSLGLSSRAELDRITQRKQAKKSAA